MKWTPYIIIVLLIFVVFRQCGNEKVRTERYIDTVIVRDTIRDTMLVPQRVYISQVDTVFLKSVGDTVYREIMVPIERKEYKTNDYHAIIEGYRPNLLQMDVYPETKYITRTQMNTIKKRPRFGVGVQVGYGYSGQGMHPYIGVGLQYNIFTF